jgi:serine/threonine protein kinase
MAEVFLGRHVSGSGVVTPCAIKRILPTYSDEPGMIDLFRDEMLITRMLRHDGIVRLFDFCEIEGAHAMVLEFVDGEDLKSLLHNRMPAGQVMPPPLAALIVAELAAALHYAHTRRDERTGKPLGIVHRDVTPENVLLGFDGAIKLTDFGIAFARDKFSKTRPGVIKGKLAYMAPEQVKGQPLDGRADVFGLSLLLWEALARETFFQRERPVELLQEITECRWRPGVLAGLGVDPRLEAVVQRGLNADRDARFATAAELEQALRGYLADLPTPASRRDLAAFVSEHAAQKAAANQAAIRAMLANPSRRSSTEDTRSGETRGGETRGDARAHEEPDDGPHAAKPPRASVVNPNVGLRNPMSRVSALATVRPSRIAATGAVSQRTHNQLPYEARGRRLGAIILALAIVMTALFVSPILGGPDFHLAALADGAIGYVAEVARGEKKVLPQLPRGKKQPAPKKLP